MFREDVFDLAGAYRAIIEGIELGVGEHAPMHADQAWRMWLWTRAR